MNVIASLSQLNENPSFRSEAFNMVGVFDVDWLLDERFTRLLDNLAASPGAFGAVRFFGALNSGEKESAFPASSGIVWPQPDKPVDLSKTLDALDALVSRHLLPFVALTFSPRRFRPRLSNRPPPSKTGSGLCRSFWITPFGDLALPRLHDGGWRSGTSLTCRPSGAATLRAIWIYTGRRQKRCCTQDIR